MTTFPSPHDDGLLPADIDLGQIFIARDDQLDLFSFYLDRWLRDMPALPSSPKRGTPSSNERIQGLLVLLYGRGGFGKSTLLKHYHDLVRMYPQKFLVSEIVDWEFAVEGKRHLFHVPREPDVDCVDYFHLLCDCLARALGKQTNDFKEYQKALKTIKEAKKQVKSEFERLKQDEQYAWMHKLASEELIGALRLLVPPLGPFLDNQTIAEAVREGMDVGFRVTQQRLGQLATKLREKMGQKLDDSLDPSLRLGFALGEDLASWSRNFPLLIFFDTYEEVDEADTLLRLVMSAAGTGVGWVLAGRDNLWAGIGQRRRTQSKSYGYKEIATPGRALAVDFNAGGVGAFTATDVLEYFTQLVERLPSGVSLPSLTEDDVQQIMEVTQGVPLAIKIAAGLYLETGNIQVISQKGESTREIVDTLVERYLLHTRDDQQERVRLYGLALLRRPDYPPAVAAALGLTPQQTIANYERELSRLQRRYSFIFTEKAQPALHQEVRHFLRLWLLARRSEPLILNISENLKQAYTKAMNTLEEKRVYGSLKERLQDEEWVDLYLDLMEQQFWLDSGEGVRCCLPFLIAAVIYQRAITQDVARIGAFFATEMRRPARTWWEEATQNLIAAKDSNPSDDVRASLIELANLGSLSVLAFPPPLPDFHLELEALLWWRLAEILKSDRNALEWYEKALTRLGLDEDLKAAASRTYVKVASPLVFSAWKNEEALPLLDRAIELLPHDVLAYTYRGSAHRNMKQYEQALADYAQALTLDPNNALAYLNRGNAYRKMKQYEQALADYARALTLDPNDARTYRNRGDAYRKMEQYEQAFADYAQALALDPNDAKTYQVRGYEYSEMGQYEQALADYTQALTLDPNDVWTYQVRGYAYSEMGQYEQALADYTQALTLDPNDVWTYRSRGYAYRKMKQYEQALADYTQALTLDPNDVWTYRSRGYAYRKMKQYEQALADYTQALTLDPNDARTYLSRSYMYLRLKKSEQALADFVRCAILEPKDVNASWMIVYAALDKQRPGVEITERLETIAVLDPQCYQACTCRGVALGLRGKLQEGLAELEHALHLNAQGENALFWKGMICAYLGCSVVAIESIEQALQAGLPPVLLTPLYWLEQDRSQLFHEYAKPLLMQYEIY